MYLSNNFLYYEYIEYISWKNKLICLIKSLMNNTKLPSNFFHTKLCVRDCTNLVLEKNTH